MRILVTGGMGFIGSHLVERLVEAGHTILVVDNFATGRRDTARTLAAKVPLVEGSIADPEVVARAFGELEPAVVVHCAASYKDPDDWAEDIRTNALGTAHVAKTARAAGVERLVYLQTALCYGSRPQEQPVTLSHPLSPENSYAISKTMGERYIALSGVPFVSLRLANMYGPRNVSGPIPTFYRRLVAGQPCVAVDTRRDFVYVDDLVELMVRVVQGEGTGGYYHVSTGRDYAIRELYDAVADALGVPGQVEERPRGPDDARTILLDPERVREEFGWSPKVDIRDGVARAVAWYQTHGVEHTFTHLRLPG